MKVRDLMNLLCAIDPEFDVALIEVKSNEDEDVEHIYEDINDIEINLRLKAIGFVINPSNEYVEGD